MRNILTFLSISTALGLMTGCDSTREALGLKRERPDETVIMEKRPLTMPPGYGLRPPVAGAKNPADYHPEDEAQEILSKKGVSGAADKSASATESAIVKKAGSNGDEDGEALREQLDGENPDKKKAPAEDLVVWKKNKPKDAEAVNAQKEYEDFYGQKHPTAQGKSDAQDTEAALAQKEHDDLLKEKQVADQSKSEPQGD